MVILRRQHPRLTRGRYVSAPADHFAVRNALEGVANVHRPTENCGPTTNGIEKLQNWLEEHGERPWDVIHFNFGCEHICVCWLLAGPVLLRDRLFSRCYPASYMYLSPLPNDRGAGAGIAG